MKVKKIGVIGCGLMGSGIAQVSAQAGYNVIVSEVNEEFLNKGLENMTRRLKIDVRRKHITEEEMDSIMSHIKGVTDLATMVNCDMVIEAIAEKMELKKRVFAELDKICAPDTILASNTSCLSIIDMAQATNRPQQVLGLHFFNPVPQMKLVEVVKTILTGDETVATAKVFAESLGKTAIIAQDTPGFIVNRLLMPFMLAACRMLENGLATREDIDEGARLGLGHPMGPLKLADLVGIDTVYYIASAIYEEIKDPLYAPPLVLKKMVSAGMLGRKSGRGFYEYRVRQGNKE